MSRGKRSVVVPFYQAPEVPFISFSLKVIKRLRWPNKIEGHEKTGLIKAHLAYEIGGCISSTYRGNLQDFRRWVSKNVKGKQLSRSLKASGILTSASQEGLLDEAEGIDLVRFTEGTWTAKNDPKGSNFGVWG